MILDPNVTNKRVLNYFSTLENKFINLHGAKYSYEHSVYTNAKTLITIYCNSCKETFTQTPDNHLQGKGCKACAMKALQDKQRMSIQDFIEKSQQIHGTKFDYSKVQYTSNDTPVTIICPDHGEFQITPTGHWVSKTGCTKCGSLEIWNSRDRPTTESFIKAANTIHSNLYDYSQTVYSGSMDKVKILCKIHGVFEQAPNNHLSGSGCPQCGLERISLAKSDTTESFIAKAKKVHGSYYSYDEVIYEHSQENVIITCPVHGKFNQIPARHLQGAGCPDCSMRGFSTMKSGLLYYLEATTKENLKLYKIGITNRTVRERYSKLDQEKFTMLYSKSFENGADALRWEPLLLRGFKEYKYSGPAVLESGNSELFTVNILPLYNKKED